MQLIIQGVKAILFSNAASGLLHEEMTCRLPLGLSTNVLLLKLLSQYGISLYAWSSNYKEHAGSLQLCLDAETFAPRLLNLDMIFDESENLYDASLMRHDSAVEQHVKNYLHKLVPSERALKSIAFDTETCTCPQMLQFLSATQFEARSKEVDLDWHAPTVVLGHAEDQVAPIRLSGPSERRLLQPKCMGEANRCSKRATREAGKSKISWHAKKRKLPETLSGQRHGHVHRLRRLQPLETLHSSTSGGMPVLRRRWSVRRSGYPFLD